ncbi:uncharacterized protein LOC127651237 [Xyrauchen texanus]|uniref:uncharacterized protein LOC127651237 n=1 Tax=Xyrauchen texanus TaxID=154827 RepID=UPI00224201FF|nr:uncharacterized protein LOC127651237 [Xyrauchen texanus]
MSVFTRCLQNLPKIRISDVHRIVDAWSPAPTSKRDKGFKLYISSYLHNYKGDSGSLQEQVKQVGTMLKTFARTGQSGADQTLMLRRLGEFGDVVRSMDNKMLCCIISVPMCLLESYPCQGICYSPLDTQEDLALLDNNLRQDKELQQRFLRFLAIKCGRDLKTTVWRMLQSIFSNHLSINTTWTGVGDKACFRDMFLKTIVQRAIRKNPATQDVTDDAIQVNVTRYLKGASEHEGGKRRRTAERDPQPTP